MRKRGYEIALLLAALTLAGCAKTPEKAIVREKGGRGVEGYQEETDAQTDAQGAAGADAMGDPAASETAVNALAQKLQAPERYTASVTPENSIFSLDCDAKIQIPDAEKVPVFQVTQKEFDQAWIDRVTDAFFGDAPIYQDSYLVAQSKPEILEQLNELKACQAEGNLDPHGIIEAAREEGQENPEEFYNIQSEIDVLEQEYAAAPETIEKVPATPALQRADGVFGGSFMGAAELEGATYCYDLKQWTSMPMEIEIKKINPAVKATLGIRYDRYGVPDEIAGKQYGAAPDEQAKLQKVQEDAAGITRQEAIARADEYMEKLGLRQEFSCKSAYLAAGRYLAGNWGMDRQDVLTEYGWEVSYTRDIDGFPVTDDGGMGGGLESMESTIEPWCYEDISITIGKDGLLAASIINLYDVGEPRVENVQMLPFPEIAGIFEQMMPIQNADLDLEGWNRMKIHIYNVTLGYMRIYDPNVDNRTGTMVPVWDFYGVREGELEYDGSTYCEESDRSFLTINAADGTVIDRELGY